MKSKIRIIKGMLLVILPAFLFSQTQNWVYSVDGDGTAMQVLYDNGNVYGVGSASTNNPEVFERTFFGVPYDEMGGAVRQGADSGYIIAGTKYSTGIYLIKLDFLGNLVWSKYYEYGTGVAYVTGLEITSDKGYILVTSVSSAICLIKTDSLGDTLWTKTYPGASPGFSSKAVQQTFDNGYIVAGTAASNNGDLYIFKTDSLGNVIWTKTLGDNRQQFGCSVRRTADSNYIIYAVSSVSGTSRASWLIKINSSGVTIWSKIYVLSGYPLGAGCAESTIDGGYIIADTYCNGWNGFLLKTNAAGDSLWCTNLDNYNTGGQPIDVQQTLDGGYIVTTQSAQYLYLSRRDSLGNKLWASNYGNGLGAWGTSVYQTLDGGYIAAGTAKTAVAGDATYDIYVVKTDSLGRAITQDFTITSLTVSGTLAWIYQYDGPKNAEDLGFTITHGLDGNFYAGGLAKGTDNMFHLTVVSIDSSGNKRWTYFYPTGATPSPISTYHNVCTVYGSDGNIYANGGASIISLSNTGALNWSYDTLNILFTSLIYGSNGNLYAAGLRNVPPSYQSNFFVLSLSTEGVERWSYEKDVGATDRAVSIVYGNDNLYACGMLGSPNALDFAVISIDTNGTERWFYTLNEGSDDIAYSVVCGSDGNIYSAGGAGFPSSMDWTIVSLTPSGNTNWVYHYDGPSHTDDWSHSITYGLDGNLYTTGWSESNGYPDFTVISIDTFGVENWVYRGPWGWGWSVVQGDNNDIYAAGDGRYLASGRGFTVISIRPPTGIEEMLLTENMSFGLEAYPNPFRDKTKVSYGVTEFGSYGVDRKTVSLRIYDAAGRLVRQWDYPTIRLLDQVVWDATDDFGRNLPAGIYFCQLECKNKRETKKIIKVQ